MTTTGPRHQGNLSVSGSVVSWTSHSTLPAGTCTLQITQTGASTRPGSSPAAGGYGYCCTVTG
jgi:hypothetical protein